MTRATTASGRVTRNTELHSKRSRRNPETSGPRAAMAPPSADHSAIERVRAGPGPQGRDEREGRRVGHAGGHAAEDPRHDEDLDGRRERGQQAGRDREQHAQDQHQLPAVPVAEGAEPQHGRREAERVADRDQVERGLGRVEGQPDGGQGDVRDREVEVGDGRDQDQGDEDQPGVLRAAAGLGRRGGSGGCGGSRCLAHGRPAGRFDGLPAVRGERSTPASPRVSPPRRGGQGRRDRTNDPAAVASGGPGRRPRHSAPQGLPMCRRCATRCGRVGARVRHDPTASAG